MAVVVWCLNQIQNWNIFRQEVFNLFSVAPPPPYALSTWLTIVIICVFFEFQYMQVNVVGVLG